MEQTIKTNIMKVKDIKSDLIRGLARRRQKEDPEPSLIHTLGFDWEKTPEGDDFWNDVDDEESEEYLKAAYPDLDIWQNAHITTDNSKVNENLLKENEELKDRLKGIKRFLSRPIHSVDDNEDLRIKDFASIILKAFFKSPHQKTADAIREQFEVTPEVLEILNEKK